MTSNATNRSLDEKRNSCALNSTALRAASLAFSEEVLLSLPELSFVAELLVIG
jgi:hypothetical protein